MKRFSAWVVVIALVGSLLSGCMGKGVGGENLAVVNGVTVTQEDLTARLKVYELFFRQSMDNPSSKQQLLDQLVRERLLMEEAGEVSLTVTDAQVEGEMAKFFGALDRQYKSRDEVNKKLQELGLTNETIAGFLKDFLTTQTMMEKQKAAVTVTDEEIKAFYEQNKGSLYTFQENVVRASHVLVPLDQETKAKEISAKAKAGGDFAELAKLYSVDPGSGRRGGDLGYFAKGTMVPEFAEAAFSMEPGQVSEPVKSQFGWHVIKLVDKQGPGNLPFEKAKDDAANQLLPQKQERALQEWIASLEQAGKVEKSSLTDGNGK